METRAEVEAKFDLAEGTPLPDLDLVAPGVRALAREPVFLDASYYDTETCSLLAHDVTLRWRGGTGGHIEQGWTLKVPVACGPGGWRRTEVVWPGCREEPPPQALRLIAGLTRGRSLRCVAVLRTVRHRVEMVHEDGTRVAEIADDTVSVEGRPAAGFRQVEVELDAGGELLARRIARVLRAGGARRSADRPKLANVLQLPPTTSRAGALRSSSTVRDVVACSLSTALSSLESYDLALRVGDDPEVVHRARVATRRARAELGALRSLLDPSWLEQARVELRWFGALLGDVRDVDVLASRLARRSEGLAASDSDGVGGLNRRLGVHRQLAAAALRAALEDGRYLELLARLEAAALSPPWHVDRLGAWTVDPGAPARPILRRLVRRRWRSLRSEVDALGAGPGDEALHRVRIAAKRLRYVAELARPVAGDRAGRVAVAAAELQDRLGALHDGAGAQEWLRSVMADRHRPPTPAEAFVAGQFLAAEQAAADAERLGWCPAWRQVRRACSRGWLG
jgi:CHAD domain-containing protein